MTIPNSAIEAASEAFLLESAKRRGELGASSLALLAALTAAAPFIAAQATADLTALIDEAESRHGSSMYCKVTTYELRKALGQDVTGWPRKSTNSGEGWMNQ